MPIRKKKKRKIHVSNDIIIVIVHGLSELCIVKYVKSVLRINIKAMSKNNGRESIQIEGLPAYLKSIAELKNFKTCKKQLGIEKQSQLHVFTFMDIDDVHDVSIKENYCDGCISGISDLWYQKNIVPIFSNQNLEDVVKDIGMEGPSNNKQKKDFYTKVFPIIHDKNECQNKLNDLKMFRGKINNCHLSNLDKLLDCCFTFAEKQKLK